MAAGRILIVDDEPGVRSSLSAILSDEGFEVEAVESGEACLDVMEKESFQALFLDVWLPGRDGLETLRALRRMGVDAAVIMISGHATIETAVRATRMGAHDFVEKPLSLEKVILTLRNALRARKLEERNRLLRQELERDVRLVGESDVIRRLRETIEAAAPTAAGVLITGESGTGKGLAARLIHARSPRADEAFVEVACRAFPAERAAEEFFGRAAGHDPAVRGKLALADEGTLYIEDADVIPPETQRQLLRALETGRFIPAGAGAPVAANARPITATEKDLLAEVEGGRFDAGLYAKLNVIPLKIPPLRERREDVPLLVEHFLDRYAREYGREPKRVETEAMEVLTNRPWPGNVRELRNVAERLVILTQGRSIHSADLRFEPGESAPARPPAPTGRLATLQEERTALERRVILERLGMMDWSVSRTAESLGVERSNLYRKMKAHRIRPA